MAGHYQKYGIDFLYPENWKLNDGEFWELPFEISIESPDGAMIMLGFFDSQSDAPELLKDFLDSLQEQYEDIEMVPADEEIAGKKGTGVDAMFYCLDFLISAKVRLFELRPFKLIVLDQAESRDFDRHELVFKAIITSLLRGLESP